MNGFEFSHKIGSILIHFVVDYFYLQCSIQSNSFSVSHFFVCLNGFNKFTGTASGFGEEK